MRSFLIALLVLLGFSLSLGLSRQAIAADKSVRVLHTKVHGHVSESGIQLDLAYEVEVPDSDLPVRIIQGEAALLRMEEAEGKHALIYDNKHRAYHYYTNNDDPHWVKGSFLVKPRQGKSNSLWQSIQVNLADGATRELTFTLDHPQTEVHIPHAVRVERKTVKGKTVITAILNRNKALEVRWKRDTSAAESRLVMTGKANIIASVQTGAMKVDHLFALSISQGKLKQLNLAVPKGLTVTSVNGKFIRDWRVQGQTLSVDLNRDVEEAYYIRINSEQGIKSMPFNHDVPVLRLLGGVRCSGHVVVGTHDAVQLKLAGQQGLTQIDKQAFPRVKFHDKADRMLPRHKAFYYRFSAMPFSLAYQVNELVPSYDANQRLVYHISEDDVVLKADVELDVRDAGLREFSLLVPKGLNITGVVSQAMVEDSFVVMKGDDGPFKRVVVTLKRPTTGRVLVNVTAEQGQSPVGRNISLSGLKVAGAQSQRGSVILVPKLGVQLPDPKATLLRQVHVGSLAVNVAGAQMGYRFRDVGWSLNLSPQKQATDMRGEMFHLVSLGDGVLYGSVTVNTFVSGAPVDQLRFRVPAFIKNIEFVGRDVRRWEKVGEEWVVSLQRKIVGDYNLGVFYTASYDPAKPVMLGEIECLDLQTQNGFIALSSHQHMTITDNVKDDINFLSIKREEIPQQYQLLVNAPILKAYKYTRVPKAPVALDIHTFRRGDVLPVVIEVMALNSTVGVLDDGGVETVTTIQYKIKNASEQFLRLKMPEGAKLWSVHSLEPKLTVANMPVHANPSGAPSGALRPAAIPKPTSIPASIDKATGMLLIPLKRQRDPNQPITLSVKYGQAHGNIGWRGELSLEAPRSEVQTTFATWRLTADKQWALLPSVSPALEVTQRAENHGSLTAILNAMADAWGQISAMLPLPVIMVLLGVFLFVSAILYGVKRVWLPRFMVGAVLVFAVVVGVMAYFAPAWQSYLAGEDPMHTIAFEQAVQLNKSSGIRVDVMVVPEWLQYVSSMWDLIIPVLIACVGLIVFIRKTQDKRSSIAGRLAGAIGLTAVLYLSAKFPILEPFVGSVLSWMIPVGVLFYWIQSRTQRKPLRVSLRWAMPLIILGVLGFSASSAWAWSWGSSLPDSTPLKAVQHTIAVEKDAIRVGMQLDIKTKDDLSIPLVPSNAIFLSLKTEDEDHRRRVEVKVSNRQHTLNIKRRGDYKVTVEFLLPRRDGLNSGLHHLDLNAPVALTNRVKFSVPQSGMKLLSPTAIAWQVAETLVDTQANGVFPPGSPIRISWQPRGRQTAQEKTQFFTRNYSIWHVQSGVVQGLHIAQMQVAQGEVAQSNITLPANAVVTSLQGSNVGSWHFDPKTHNLKVKYLKPITGQYALQFTTQTPVASLPATVTLNPFWVQSADRQMGAWGLAPSAMAHVSMEKSPQTFHVDDFNRVVNNFAAYRALMTSVPVRYAYRVQSPTDALVFGVRAVESEIRSHEVSAFSISDQRLVFNTQLNIELSKAGLFSVVLQLPNDYDIDTLSATGLSHWDEVPSEGERLVQVHFKKKTKGAVPLRITLSRPETALPKSTKVPRIVVKHSLKHTGSVHVMAERGVRLTVSEKQGVAEVNPRQLGIKQQGALAFKLLKPDWQIALTSEAVAPRMTVDFLHVAKVDDGLVNYRAYLRYKLLNAGAKQFSVRLPENIFGLQIQGPHVAQVKADDADPQVWHVLLKEKWFDRPYPMTIQFEQPLKSDGSIVMVPVKAKGVDVQRGTLAVVGTNRMEMFSPSVSDGMQPSDARNIERHFGAGDLSSAAFCYAVSNVDYEFSFKTRRHSNADLLEAEVSSTAISTVVTPTGDTLTRVNMSLSVADKRSLGVLLPAGSHVWSLSINEQAVAPSLVDSTQEGVHIRAPLPHGGEVEANAELVLVYVLPAPEDWDVKNPAFHGPQFDIPLKQVTWMLYMPERFEYDEHEGTMTVQEKQERRSKVLRYTLRQYEGEVERRLKFNVNKAHELQRRSKALAKSGQQLKAKQALNDALNYSVVDEALNEDNRVELHNLIRQQALIGLVSRRGYVRNQHENVGDIVVQTEQIANFDESDVERIQSNLSRRDSENLEIITNRIIEMQEAAAKAGSQLAVALPTRGVAVTFERALQVNAMTPMHVRFKAKPRQAALAGAWGPSALCALVLFLMLLGAPKCQLIYGQWVTEVNARAEAKKKMAEEKSRQVQSEKKAFERTPMTPDSEPEDVAIIENPEIVDGEDTV